MSGSMIQLPQLTHKSIHSVEKDGKLIHSAAVKNFDKSLLATRNNYQLCGKIRDTVR